MNVFVKKAAISTDTSAIAKKVINGMEFVSIQDEEYRTYRVPTKFGKCFVVQIDEPQWLYVRPSGSHMVIDKQGLTHYIPDFIHLVWFNGDRTPANF